MNGKTKIAGRFLPRRHIFKETKIKSWLKADNLSPLSHALYTVTRFFEAYPKKEEKGRINCVTFVVNHNNWCWLYNPMSAD